MEIGDCEPYKAPVNDQQCSERLSAAKSSDGKFWALCLDCKNPLVVVDDKAPEIKKEAVEDSNHCVECSSALDDHREWCSEATILPQEEESLGNPVHPDAVRCVKCKELADLEAKAGSKNYFYKRSGLCTLCYRKTWREKQKGKESEGKVSAQPTPPFTEREKEEEIKVEVEHEEDVRVRACGNIVKSLLRNPDVLDKLLGLAKKERRTPGDQVLCMIENIGLEEE